MVAEDLAADLAKTYVIERRSKYVLYPDALATLELLHGRARLGLVTNGPADLQREKIARTGLDRWFEEIAISAEIGIGKPDPAIFHRVIDALSVPPGQTVMVGDAPERDVVGARACGMRAVWVDRRSRPAPSSPPDFAAHDLTDLVGWLDAGAPARGSN